MKQQRTLLFLRLGAALLLAACAGDLGDGNAPTTPPQQAGLTSAPVVAPGPTPVEEHRDAPSNGDGNGYDAGHNGGDEPHGDADHYDYDGHAPHPAAHLEFQGFTHFPMDFAEAFANPVGALWYEDGSLTHALPFTPFFNPPHKTISPRKWYFYHPHYETEYDHDLNTIRSDWKVYLVADAVLSAEHIGVWTDRHGNSLDGNSYPTVDPALLAVEETPDGDRVYLGVEPGFWASDHLVVGYEKLRLRKEIVETVMAQGGSATFPAGTHIGYGANALTVVDESVDSGGYFQAVNPFDYFTEEKQQALLALYQPLYERLKDEGLRPFTDITESRLWWDVPGSIEGGWTNTDAPDSGLPGAEWWVHISIVGLDYLTAETYWRVLEHPWNVENNFLGIFVENDIEFRFYLLDGDLSDGVAMVIQEWDTGEGPVWRPREPETANNHPSVGKRWYLRFLVQPSDHIWEEPLSIERFTGEEEARAGFTDNAVIYKRGFHYR